MLSDTARALLGPRGAKLTVRPKGTRKTVGIPGTGLFYTKSDPYQNKGAADPGPGPASSPGNRIIGFLLVIIFALAVIVISLLSR